MIRKDSSVLIPTAIAFAVALFIYLLTMSRSVGWHDSAELALTAWLFAANHAPGSPLHTLIGYLPATLMSEPHFATTLLSVIAAALSVGLLAGLIYRLVGDALLAVLAALLFGLSFQVWATAVITELYSLSTVFLGAAMLAAWYWQGSRSALAWRVMLLAYSLSLAAYFANILLWPAFVFLIYKSGSGAVRNVTVFTVITGLAVLLVATANYQLAGHAFPFGAANPDSLTGMFSYMSGAQHDPLQTGGFSLSRLAEHIGIFSRSYVYLPLILAVIGLRELHIRNSVYAGFTALVFLIYILYYTLFGSGDYYFMVNPAYFVCAIWASCGVMWINENVLRNKSRLPGYAVLILLLGAQLMQQFEGRRSMARDLSAERFAAEAFEYLPQGSVAVTGWRELTTLNYFQAVHGERADIRFLLPARTPRYYRHGIIADYVLFIEELACTHPVYTMKPLPDLQAEFEPVTGPVEAQWQKVEPAANCGSG